MTQTREGIKETINNLIKVATSFSIKSLETIYHESLQVIMFTSSGEKIISNKEDFKALFKEKKDNGDDPLNTWAAFKHIEHKEEKGHVIINRKVNLTGIEENIVLSIDLIWEDARWQVTREVIFTLPKEM